jgi:hypothetical protein
MQPQCLSNRTTCCGSYKHGLAGRCTPYSLIIALVTGVAGYRHLMRGARDEELRLILPELIAKSSIMAAGR